MPKHVIITYYRRKRLPFANTQCHRHRCSGTDCCDQ